jgi:hypothetical protein
MIGLRRLLLPGALLGAVAVAATGPPALGQPPPAFELRFEREYIRVLIQPAGVRVDGTYYFRNESPTAGAVMLFYPFPVDSLHPRPTRIVVYSENGDTLPFSQPSADGILFRVDLPAGGMSSARVVYDQPSLDRAACYILTTTSAWRRPLERAEFEISVPSGLRLESMTYDADEVAEKPTGRVYRFRREKFMPTRDLCVSWVVR